MHEEKLALQAIKNSYESIGFRNAVLIMKRVAKRSLTNEIDNDSQIYNMALNDIVRVCDLLLCNQIEDDTFFGKEKIINILNNLDEIKQS